MKVLLNRAGEMIDVTRISAAGPLLKEKRPFARRKTAKAEGRSMVRWRTGDSDGICGVSGSHSRSCSVRLAGAALPSREKSGHLMFQNR